DLLKVSLARINDVSRSLLLLSDGTVLPNKMVRLDIQKLLNEVYEEAGAQVRSAGLQFDWQSHGETLFVRGDVMRLKQVVINLIDNAVKYNSAGGMVKMKAWGESNFAIIEVSDSGVGIPAADLPHVFDRFFRVDKSRSRERGGSGLGLAIVKKIVEEHGGKVTAQSVDGTGSSFRIKLPLLRS
ncbi:MAG: cell wall metabolism sensor histidine kinase WalK, partial [Dehalococcoidia bacterium]|nr:cell wall metabolism sensor histidine kinase WalK [Dehalococcoidia bacterium]